MPICWQLSDWMTFFLSIPSLTILQLHEHRAAVVFQQAGIETKPGEYQHFLEQVQYYNDHQQQPNSFLQLATLPSEIDLNYHLHLAQPNLQKDPMANIWLILDQIYSFFIETNKWTMKYRFLSFITCFNLPMPSTLCMFVLTWNLV